MKSSMLSYSEDIFNYLVDHPSSTAHEVARGLDLDTQRCRSIINDLWKRGKLERKSIPSYDGYRRTVYSYWTTSSKLERKKSGRASKKKAVEFEIPADWIAKPPLLDRIPEPPVQQKDRGLEDLLGRINKTPPPEKNAANTVHHEVTLNINAHPVILSILEKLSKHL